ncbi:hypothetical protein QUA07_28580 [Microcoleus sp. T3_A4]|uniref:hypothetical protein n=1 Tax=Microcoleus sp. T3_A4 TaxID=2818968 RepID=UPI002FD70803
MREIQNDLARGFLIRASNAIQQEDYTKAVSYATTALDIVFMKASEFFFGQFPFKFDTFQKLNQINSTKGISGVSSELKEGIKALKDGVQHSVDRIQELEEITICYGLGINIEQYVRYRKMAGYFAPTAVGDEVYQKSGLFSRSKFSFDKKDAEVSLNYCAKTIINIEETLQRLNKPLSEE